MNVNQWGAVNQWGGAAPNVVELSGSVGMPVMLSSGVMDIEQPGTVTITGGVIMPSMIAIGGIDPTSPDPELTGSVLMPSMLVSGSIQGPMIRLKARKVIRVL